MLTVNLFDHNFPNQACSVANQTPAKLQYVRNQAQWEGITFYTDGEMFSADKSGHTGPRFGWLHEGMELHPENYAQVWSVLPELTAVFTTEPHLWQQHDKFWPVVRGGSWVPRSWHGLYPKTGNIAMVTSEKAQTSGHKLRHAVVEAIKGMPVQVDHFGFYGQKFGTDKRIPYLNHRFAIIIEAQRAPGFFSEHLLDAMAFGCYPIYWGAPDIAAFFDYRGLLQFDRIEQLNGILPNLNEYTYTKALPYIEENLKRMQEYVVTEDWIVTNLLEPFYGTTF